MIRSLLPISLVIVVAMMARFLLINSIPAGLNYDEASIVYNAWSLALWHRDENAQFMPLSFQSFGDYKPPGLIYLLAAIYRFTGLEIYLLRFISGTSGVISVALIYAMAKELWGHKSTNLTLLTGILAAITPWGVTLNRTGYEQNLAAMLINLGFLGLLKAGKNKVWGIAGILSLWASMYTFHTAKITAPLIIFGFMVGYRKWLWQNRLKTMIGIGALLIGLSPLIWDTFWLNGGQRANTLIFGQSDWWRLLGVNLFNYLNPSFWVGGWDGVSLRHSVPGFGVLYWVEWILLMVGLVVVKRDQAYLRWLFLATLLPGLISQGSPHALRTLFALTPTVLLVVYGWQWCLKLRPALNRWWWSFLIATLAINTFMFTREYTNQYRIDSASAFQWGYEEVIETINRLNPNEDTKIYITDSYGQPYIYVLLYNRITPQTYLWGGLNQYRFGSIDWTNPEPNCIYAGTAKEIPPNDPRVIETLRVESGEEPLWVIAKT